MQWNNWLRRRGWERGMDAELRFHLESRREELVRAGKSPEEAERQARREFGAVELAKDECRDEKPMEWLDRGVRALRYGLRSLCKSPGFTLVAVGTLALGIGANTAIFQLLDAVRLRTLPVSNSAQLATVQLADRIGWRGSQASPYPALTNPIWEQFRDTQQAFSGVLAWSSNGFNLSPGGEARVARGLFVSGNFFHVLGVEPLMGRVFSAADDRRGCGLPGAVISYAFWQRELGGDASAIGRKLTLNMHPVEVIGVTPAGFSGLEVGHTYDVAVPICSQAVLWNEGNWLNEGTVWWLNVMGRLRPGQTLQQANAQLQAASAALFRSTLPANYPPINVKDYLKFKLAAVAAGNGVSELRMDYEDPLLLLLATSGLVLLIACANLANLILARATAREHEFAVRLAIGAARGSLVRQLMVENGMLAVGGAVLGAAVSGVLSRLLVSLLGGAGDALFLDLQPDLPMLAFTAILTGLTCILFGLAPALRATRIPPSGVMKTGGRTRTAGRGRFELRQVLVVSQVALSVVLLAGGLLFSGTLRNLMAVNAGFQYNGILVANVDFSRLNIPKGGRVDFRHELLEKIRALPGVASAADVEMLPLGGGSTNNAVWKDGENPNNRVDVNFNWFGEGYMKTVSMRLLAGRDFNARDTAASTPVAIVNQSFARKLGLGRDPVGMRFHREATPSSPEMVFEIVGVTADTKYHNLREGAVPIAFLSVDQQGAEDPFAMVLVRSLLPLKATTAAVRSSLGQVSPAIGLDFSSYGEVVRNGLLRERLMATLSGFFGGLAALISAIGLYGVMSYLVVRRTNEIGLRMALGAGRGSVVALIFRQAGVLMAIGIAAGIGLTLALAGVARSILFGLQPYDPRTLAMAALLLALVAAAACYLPARRAARLEPIVALREE